MTNTQLSIAAGLVLGLLFTASPLTVVTLAAIVLLLTFVGRDLPPHERRILTVTVAAALAFRAAAIGGLVVIGIPQHNDLAIGSMSGDDAYYLSRAIRARDILMGYAGGSYDYFVVNDEYGRTSYVGLLTALQVIFGPTPFSIRLLNAVLFVIGAVVFFRIARPAFGWLPAITGLVIILFLPSLLWSSISILKESAYFLCSAVLLWSAIGLTRAPGPRRVLALVVTSALVLWLLDDLRRGALGLALAGLGCAVLIRLAAVTRWRLAAVCVAAAAVAALALTQPRVQARVVDAIESAGRVHGGHVFTMGHAYKLLDEGFYKNPAAPASWPLELTGPQAARFVVRAVVAFVTIPWPWQMRSLGEFAYLPDQLIWYLILVGLPAGVLAGWKRDPWTVAVLLGFAIPVAAAVALTNGNVGTLLRMRGLVTPYLIWISMLGLFVMTNAIAGARQRSMLSMAGPVEGHA